jgi:hypothetical protein
MESSRIASFQRAVNRLARRLGRAGLIDHEREALRKSDHRNPLRSHEHFDALCASAHLAVAERRYYNVVAKAVVEDLGLRLFEQLRNRKKPAPAHHGHDHDHAGHGHEPAAPPDGAPRTLGAPLPGRGMLLAGRALTALLRLDMIFFGRVRTGPFFGLIRTVPRGAAPPANVGARASEPA